MRLHQTKKLLYSKQNYEQNETNERQSTEWEKHLQVTYLLYIQNIERTHTTEQQTDTTHTTEQQSEHLMKKWAEDLKRHFSKEDIQVVNRSRKRCSILLIIRKIPVKTTMRYHFISVRITVIKKTRNNKSWVE